MANRIFSPEENTDIYSSCSLVLIAMVEANFQGDTTEIRQLIDGKNWSALSVNDGWRRLLREARAISFDNEVLFNHLWWLRHHLHEEMFGFDTPFAA